MASPSIPIDLTDAPAVIIRLRRRTRGSARAARHRHRDRRFDHLSGVAQRRRRHQAGRGHRAREGIVPISSSQDSAGPMARTVRDVAALYEVLTGLDHVLERVARGFDGARVAVATNLTTGHPATDQLFRDVIESARNAGTTFSEVVVTEADAAVEADELTVLLSEMSDDLTAFLQRRGGPGPSTLEECIDFEDDHRDVELPFFGHEFFDQALASGGRRGEKYRDARSRNLTWAVDQCLKPALAMSIVSSRPVTAPPGRTTLCWEGAAAPVGPRLPRPRPSQDGRSPRCRWA